jgi:hypothetical protein
MNSMALYLMRVATGQGGKETEERRIDPPRFFLALLPDRLAGLGVPDGPLRGDLAEGRPVVLADGRNIDPEDVPGPPEGRKKLLVVGDTETTDGLTCLMIRPGTFRAMMAVWQCGRKRTKCCDACKTAD